MNLLAYFLIIDFLLLHLCFWICNTLKTIWGKKKKKKHRIIIPLSMLALHVLVPNTLLQQAVSCIHKKYTDLYGQSFFEKILHCHLEIPYFLSFCV